MFKKNRIHWKIVNLTKTAATVGLIILIHLLFSFGLEGQGFLKVRQIVIEGNHYTRDHIIFKELDFSSGDTLFLDKLYNRLDINRKRVLNTGLFNHVEINVTDWDVEKMEATIVIKGIENWFYYPVPILELGDRSVNEWIYQHGAALNRLNLGISFMHINLTGNADKLKLTFHRGFTQKYELDYYFPYLDGKQTLGAFFNTLYVTHNNLEYITRENQLVFTGKDPGKTHLTRFRMRFGLQLRRNQKYKHTLLAEYHHKTISDSIVGLNPRFFQLNETNIRHFSLIYRMLYNNVDFNLYPTSGNKVFLELKKEGIGVWDDLNYFQVTAGYEQHFKYNENFSTQLKLKGRYSLYDDRGIPYHYGKALGYFGDIITGYHLYVIDGPHYGYLQTTQKWKLLNTNYDLGRYMPLKNFKVMALQAYLGFHGDLAYVYQPWQTEHNPYNNRLLYGLGLSFDLIVFQNYFFSLEANVNHLGQPGIFLGGSNTFM